MKSKENGWVKDSFDIELAYDDVKIHIDNGRVYKFFGVDDHSKHRKLYHLPTKTFFGKYNLTLQKIKEMVDYLLEVNIDWSSSDKQYFETIDNDIKKQIDKITIRYK